MGRPVGKRETLGGPDGIEQCVTTVREPEIAHVVVFVDGLPGCGKTMMTPIVGALDRVELMQYSYELEYTCVLRFLDKIADDAGTTLIRNFTDLRQYNIAQGREMNLRWSDLSGVRFNARKWSNLARLFRPGDAAAVDRIERERPILNIVIHLILGISEPIFKALGSRARIIEVVRHPLYMLKQQVAYMHRWGTDPRDFTMCMDHDGGRPVPWFTRGWEQEWLDAGPMDRSILMIDRFQALIRDTRARLGERARDQVMVIPFERFVTTPEPYMSRMEQFLGTRVTAVTRREMRRQNVPRKMYAEGIGRDIYRQYGWEPPRSTDEQGEFERRRRFVAEQATEKGLEILDRLCREYEEQYLQQERV